MKSEYNLKKNMCNPKTKLKVRVFYEGNFFYVDN